jgi:Reverse transcriptase (RNA-dependent DNA polymerase)
VVTKPTRCNINAATCIDHFVTNSMQPTFDTRILLSRISDHFPIVFTVNQSKIKSCNHNYVTTRDFSACNVTRFTNSLVLSDWNPVLSCNDSDSALDKFTVTFKTLHEQFFAPKVKRFNKNVNKKEKWMTNGLLKSRLTKLKLAKNCSLNTSVANTSLYKNFRNMYNRLIRLSHKLYFEQELLANSKNLRKTWQLLYEALNVTKNKEQITSLIVNNQLIENSTEMANNFNYFFTSIAEKISSKINPAEEEIDVSIPAHRFSMSNLPIDHSELTNAINELQDKKSTDLNDISMHLVKRSLPFISEPLLHIFNKSLEQGVVPKKFKIAKVIPIFKSGNPQDMNNYRPISLLCTFSKILEKIVFLRLTKYIDQFNLLSANQFGFRPKHSTFHPMLDILNSASDALNKKKHMLIIFCDLQKAFDTCDIKILLKKLQKFGVVGTELAWFCSYLSDRWQYVSLNGHDSILLQILTGVPQGSILGPLLFLIYIDDLPECSDMGSKLFADDTALITCYDDLQNLIHKTNTEFQKVCKYFRKNKLSLHPDKTKYIIISNSRMVHVSPSEIFINNNNLNQNDPNLKREIARVLPTDETPAIKYLGVYFDPNLNFEFHVQNISKKLSRALFQIRRVKNILS